MEALVRRGVRAEVGGMFDDMRRFMDRRIAEVSAEVNATVQLVDYSEANLSGQLARIHEQILSVIAAPSQAARNSGLELEAVVVATDLAANRIMEAAEAIETWVKEGQNNPAALASVPNEIAAIFEACSFQDLTGQRIRRAIEHLQNVETMLGSMIPPGTEPVEMEAAVVRSGMVAVVANAAINPDMNQDAIDALLDF